MMKFPPTPRDKPTVEFFSGDPALRQPPASASDDELKAHLEVVARCRETRNLGELLLEGQETTRFLMWRLTGDQWRKLSDLKGNPMTLLQMAFRCCIASIENGGEMKVTFIEDPKFGTIATLATCNILDAYAPELINELGALALNRGCGLPPHH